LAGVKNTNFIFARFVIVHPTPFLLRDTLNGFTAQF
jgi:hypothetical protein